MRRKIYDQMLAWKQKNSGNTALLIEGARRVGKSYIAREFAEREYESYILIDFNRAGKEICSLFEDNLNDLDSFFMYLSGAYGVKLIPGRSMIILDEIQMFPRARAAVKYLVEDGRFDYLETGSLVSIRKNVKDIVIPSEERHIQMNPMDFEEFLWAMGNDTLMDVVRMMFQKQKPMGQAMHRTAMNYFRQYLIVGGMPQAVDTYARSRDFDEVDQVKRDILRLYREDITKHAEGYEIKVANIFDEIPAQLQKHDHKFQLSDISETARYRSYQDAFFWLNDAGIVLNCYNTTEPSIGLRLNMERMTYKCYMADTGLLISHAFDENGLVTEELYRKILFDKLEANLGMITENIAAQMLVAGGHKLYFYYNPAPKDVDSRMEIDFLIAKSKISSRHNISPIEVKSGKKYTLTSIKKCIQKYHEQISTAYVLHNGDVKVEDGIVYLPLYMTSLL